MIYTEANRGLIQNRERMKQLISFEGMKFDGVTPTDIDCFFEKNDRYFVFYEYKYGNAVIPEGQELALTRIVNALDSTGREAILLWCIHNAQQDEDIQGKDATVVCAYYKHKWCDCGRRTAKEVTDAFIRYIKEGKHGTQNRIS